jgi:hypothetical protein
MQPTTTNCQKQVKNTTADKPYGFVRHQSIPIFIDTKHASRAFQNTRGKPLNPFTQLTTVDRSSILSVTAVAAEHIFSGVRTMMLWFGHSKKLE